MLDGGPIAMTYATTFGCAIGLPEEASEDLLPHVPGFPKVTMAVVDTGDPSTVVGYGQVGRVRLTVLHNEPFLPNVLEYDQAVRYETGPEWPCDGIANVQPLKASRAIPEGL